MLLRSRDVPVVMSDHENKDPSWALDNQPWTSDHYSRVQVGPSKAKLAIPPPPLPETSSKEFPSLDISQVGIKGDLKKKGVIRDKQPNHFKVCE